MQHHYTNRQMLDDAQKMAVMSAGALNKDIELHLRSQAVVVETAALFTAQQRWSDEDILAYLTGILEQENSFTSLYFYSTDNYLVNASGWELPNGYDLRDRPWYRKAISNGGTITTEAFLNASRDKLIVTIACPVYGRNSDLVGVMGGDISLDDIATLVTDRESGNSGFSFLIDSQHNILAHPEISYNPGNELISLSSFYEGMEIYPLDEDLTVSNLALNGVDGYLAYTPVAETDWHLASFIPLSQINTAASRLNSYYILAVSTTLLVFLLFLFYHNRWIHRPLLQFENNINRINVENSPSYRLPVAGGSEFTTLGCTINMLLDRIQTYVEKLEENEQSLLKTNLELEKLVAELTTVEEALDYSEEKLYYLSYHDQLTGLYNRAFFEAKMRYLSSKPEYPVTIISADIDGLKLINDTIGQSAGNKLIRQGASILNDVLDGSGILARVGGDEFSAVLPLTGEDEAERIARQIRYQISLYNQENSNLPLSISLGVATATDRSKSLKKLLKEADDLMFRAKLYNSTSVRNGVVQSLMAALAERDYFIEGHARRLEKLCLKVGEKVGLSSHQLTDLALLAQVHDLGKVGIPDQILHKPGPLTEEEWDIMKQHCEKGYRIASSAPDLANVANLILRHHEHWDGSGYPLGLSKQNIPVECRILAVVDAFDAMTHNRPYKKKVSKDDALQELINCAGTQFDPEIVSVFLTLADQL